MLCCSIDLGHPHLAMAGVQHPPSHPCNASVELRQLGLLGEPKLDRQQIPDRQISVFDKYGIMLSELTKPGLPTSFLASHRKGFSKL